jgi:cytochrome c553
MKTILSIAIASALLSIGLPAQEKKIEVVPIKKTFTASGIENYKAYCAVCHGVAGKGDGPAASALKAPPSDLTMLAVHNKGKFPSNRVRAIMTGQEKVAAHGTSEMPTWGPLFRSFESEMDTKLRLGNLIDYLETLQKK